MGDRVTTHSTREQGKVYYRRNGCDEGRGGGLFAEIRLDLASGLALRHDLDGADNDNIQQQLRLAHAEIA